MANFAFQVTGAFQGNGQFAFQGATGVAPVVTTPADTGGHHKEKKRRSLFDLEFNGLPEPEKAVIVPRETIEVLEAKSSANDLSEKIVEAHSEISRIKTRMRLQSNDAAIKAMEHEIAAIERHLVEVKREQEDEILLLLLM